MQDFLIYFTIILIGISVASFTSKSSIVENKITHTPAVTKPVVSTKDLRTNLAEVEVKCDRIESFLNERKQGYAK